MTPKEGVKFAINIFKEIQGDAFKQDNFDIGILESGKRLQINN